MKTGTQKWKILSGSSLKLIAMLFMLIDHIALFLLYDCDQMLAPLFVIGTKEITAYYILRTIGRTVFPLYCFLLCEGFAYTKSRKKYAANLLIFAIISELPWNFIHTGTLFYGRQNIFFTLLLGCLALYVLEQFKDRKVIQVLGVLGLFIISYFFKADYGYMGFIAIIAMYMLRENAISRALVCTCLFSEKFRSGLAFIPIALYNGKRGFIHGKVGKYVCYAFYPIHILILALIRIFILK